MSDQAKFIQQQQAHQQPGLSMAEKLRLWKAEKAKAAAPPTASTTTTTSKTIVTKSTANAHAVVTTKKTIHSTTTTTVAPVNNKRAFSSISMDEKNSNKTKSVIESRVSKKPKNEAPAVQPISTSAAVIQEAPIVHAPPVMMEEVEDANEDLGISFTATGLTPPTIEFKRAIDSRVQTPVVQSQSSTATMDMDMDQPAAAAVEPQPKRSNVTTPNAASLHDQFKLTPPPSSISTLTRQSSNSSVTPIADSLMRKLQRTDAPNTNSKMGSTLTPHADRLRELFKKQATPSQTVTRATNSSCTPIAAALASQFALEQRPTFQPSSTSKPTTITHLLTPANVSPVELTPPAASLDSSVDSSNASDTPVARNLMSEMNDLNGSRQDMSDDSLCISLDHSMDNSTVVAEEVGSTKDQDVQMCDTAPPAPTATIPTLFQEDEFIPGLSTPAPFTYTKESSPPAPTQPFQLFSNEEDSPISKPLISPTPSKRHARLLTPSKAHLASQEASAVETGGRSVVFASVKAHPRDAQRMGSATFLSPVRRSRRNSLEEEKAVPMEEVDQGSLKKLLEENNYAYRPNTALAHELTPIPVKRASKKTPALVDQLEVIQEVAPTTTSTRAQPSTPIPSRSLSAGSSVVVLQAVRSRRRSNSMTSPDPRSSDYLLSPVRRSARHTNPQSMAELTKLLTTTQYAYQPNPLIDDSVIGMNGTESPAAAAAASAPTTVTSASRRKSLAAIEEEEVDELDRVIEIEREMMEMMEETAAHNKKSNQFQSPMVVMETSTRKSPRLGTPMPNKTSSKGQPSPTILVESFNWEKSYGSGGPPEREIDHPMEPATRSSNSKYDKELVNERDADGFLIPLPVTKRSKGSKRKGTSLDDIENKLSLVAVTMMEKQYRREQAQEDDPFRFGPSSIPAPPSKQQTRQPTPRPLTKKQKRSDDSSLSSTTYGMDYDPTRVDTPIAITRRSTRVATPMH